MQRRWVQKMSGGTNGEDSQILWLWHMTHLCYKSHTCVAMMPRASVCTCDPKRQLRRDRMSSETNKETERAREPVNTGLRLHHTGRSVWVLSQSAAVPSHPEPEPKSHPLSAGFSLEHSVHTHTHAKFGTPSISTIILNKKRYQISIV